MCKGHTFAYQLVYNRRFHIGIAQSTDRVKALLIGAVPEDIRTLAQLLISKEFRKLVIGDEKSISRSDR